MVARALGQELDQKRVGTQISSQALRDSMLADMNLGRLTQPAIQMSDQDSLMRRQLAGYERDLLSNMLDYDLGTEELASTLRQEGVKSLLDFLATGNYARNTERLIMANGINLTPIQNQMRRELIVDPAENLRRVQQRERSLINTLGINPNRPGGMLARSALGVITHS